MASLHGEARNSEDERVDMTTLERDRKIEELYTSSSEETLESVASAVGLSKERVGQILAARGVKRRNSRDYADNRRNRSYGETFVTLVRDAYREIGTVDGVAYDIDAPAWRVNAALKELGDDFRVAYRRIGKTNAKYGLRSLENSLQDALEHVGVDGTLSSTAYAKWAEENDRPRLHTLLARLGSWPDVCETFGIESADSRAGRKPEYTPDECVNRVVQCYESIGHLPTMEEFNDFIDRPSAATVQRLCGGWKKALNRAYRQIEGC